ncbi:hypothetical protein NECAME_04035 [Necator americanus]|uniref:N-acetyltransferase domain-containing protein n=1 Tax=Necator americanus TaxID=51031 RepID=W2SZF7_NECAM|nr:hypothetical protein NECAME_04035 [Necator americanus]ETN74356.1 hypothetical protein NECAME_04035 [Necator americanus]
MVPCLSGEATDPQFRFAFMPRREATVSNGSAIQFYEKRGFTIVETTKNYYNRCIPADAYVMQKQLV